MTIETRSIPAGHIAWSWSHGPVPDPVVVIHGLADSAIHTFAPMFASTALASTPALFIDLPGFGEGFAQQEFDGRIEACAEIVAEHLRHLGVAPRAIFGHSMGGSIGILLAQASPALVRNLIVAEALLVPENSVLANNLTRRTESEFLQRGFAMLQRATQRQATRGDSAASAFLRPLAMANPAIAYRAAESLVQPRDPHLGEILARLPMPRTFLVGGHTEADTLGIEHHGVNIVRIPGAGHSMMSEQPELTARAIHAALD